MSAPRVSVIVCAYDAAATIADCLESLFAQTVSDFEVVVVDDGSTDGTSAEVERVAEGRGVPVRIVRTEHAGLAGARNSGIAEATGEWLSFVDADDLAEPSMIERMLACAESSGAEIVVCDILYVDFETGAPMHTHREGDPALFGGSVVERPGLLAQLGGGICNKLVHRSLFERSGISFPVGRFFEDLWVTYRLYREARSIAKVDGAMYRYRIGRSGSIVGVYDDRYLDIPEALAATNEHYVARGEFETLRSDLLAVNFLHALFGRYTNVLLFGPRDVRHRYLASAFAHLDRYFPDWRDAPEVRRMTGRYAKHVVFTHRALLQLYTDSRRGRVG